jgi:small conductance mechanosensitive channel
VKTSKWFSRRDPTSFHGSNRRVGLPGLLWLCALLAWTPPILTMTRAAEPPPAVARTVQDPGIPPDQLRWLLKPLTREDLVVEAEAWRNLLKITVTDIGRAEIALKRVQVKSRETPSTPGPAAITEGAGESRPDPAIPNVGEAAVPRTQLLSSLASLREQRSALIDRFNVVLVELKAKGGEVAALEQYRDAVAEIIVDVTDTSAAWTFFYGWLKSEHGGLKWGMNIIKFAVIFLVFWFLSKMVGKAAEKATGAAKGLSTLLRQFMVMAARRGVLIIGLLVAISAMGVPVGPLLAVITAAGFVIGLALQGTLSNFASGLLLLFYRPFDVGDAIDAGGVAGSVKDMNLMSTRIQTWDNKSMIVPNNSIWGSVITNISRTDRRRVDLTFGIAYSDSIDKAQAILEKIVADHPKVLKDPAFTVRLHELGESSVNFVVRPWVLPANYWEVYWDVTRKVKEEFDRQGVTIPFPQRDVHLYKTAD